MFHHYHEGSGFVKIKWEPELYSYCTLCTYLHVWSLLSERKNQSGDECKCPSYLTSFYTHHTQCYTFQHLEHILVDCKQHLVSLCQDSQWSKQTQVLKLWGLASAATEDAVAAFWTSVSQWPLQWVQIGFAKENVWCSSTSNSRSPSPQSRGHETKQLNCEYNRTNTWQMQH
jgi:hypothetical protein